MLLTGALTRIPSCAILGSCSKEHVIECFLGNLILRMRPSARSTIPPTAVPFWKETILDSAAVDPVEDTSQIRTLEIP